MATYRDFVLRYGDSWTSPKLWAPIVNGLTTNLNEYFIRAQAREYQTEVEPVFMWSVADGNIIISRVTVRLSDGATFDTDAFRLTMSPSDWRNKPHNWTGSLEIEIASDDDDYPNYRKTIVSDQVIKVIGDSAR